MKTLFCFLFLFAIFFAHNVFAQIQITEIMYNPDGNDNDREWFEAINFGNPINVKTGKDGWRINDGKNHYFQSKSFLWNTNEIIVFAQDKEKFFNDYPSVNVNLIKSNFYLKNTEGEIQIIDENKNILSKAIYQDIADSGYSIIFKNNIWQSETKNGTPGAIFDLSVVSNYELPAPVISQSSIIESENNTGNTSSNTTSAEQTAKLLPNITTSSNSIVPDFPSIIPNLLISEFLPDTLGKDENEFIELINSSEENINLSDFSVIVGGKKIKLTEATSKKFITLWKADYKFSIRNKGETISLLYKDKEIHKINYSGKAQAGRSFAKIDNEWFWTRPTPGEKNIFEKIQDRIVETNNKNSNENETENFQEKSSFDFFANTQGSARIKNSESFNPIILAILIAIILSIALVLLFFKL